jgi:hypothetical protein
MRFDTWLKFTDQLREVEILKLLSAVDSTLSFKEQNGTNKAHETSRFVIPQFAPNCYCAADQ